MIMFICLSLNSFNQKNAKHFICTDTGIMIIQRQELFKDMPQAIAKQGVLSFRSDFIRHKSLILNKKHSLILEQPSIKKCQIQNLKLKSLTQLTYQQSNSKVTSCESADKAQIDVNSKQQSTNIESVQSVNQFTKQSESTVWPRDNVEIQSRFQKVLRNMIKFVPQFWKKLLNHLSKTSTADKYIRLVYSIMKIYRALNPQNKLSGITRQLLIARRVIQWDCKYQIVHQFRSEDLSRLQIAYKTFQLSSNLMDLSSFWLQIFQKQHPSFKNLSEMFFQWQDNCYFGQCLIELGLSFKKIVENLLLYRRIQQQSYRSLKKTQILVQNQQIHSQSVQEMQKLSKIYKRPGQSLIGYFQQILQIKRKLKQNQSQACKQQGMSSVQEDKNKIMRQILKNLVKVMKFTLDSITAYNNSSQKTFVLDPLIGGCMSTVSSLLSMCLIWCF